MSYLQNISDGIVSALCNAGYYEKIFPLCEMYTNINRDGEQIRFPAYYQGLDNFEQVHNFDKYQGVAYHRLTGPVTSEAVDSIVAGKNRTRITYPIAIVSVVPRVNIEDSAFADDRAYNRIVKEVNYLLDTIKQQAGVYGVNVTFNGYANDKNQIEGEEYVGISSMRIRYKYSYIKIDLSITLVADECVDDCI